MNSFLWKQDDSKFNHNLGTIEFFPRGKHFFWVKEITHCLVAGGNNNSNNNNNNNKEKEKGK